METEMQIQQQALSEKEMIFLEENTALTRDIPSDIFMSVNTINDLSSALTSLTDRLQSPQLVITAAQFSKSYSYAMTMPILYAMTAWNKGLNASFENSNIHILNNNIYQIQLDDLSFQEVEQNDRQKWRDRILEKLFKENLSLLHKNLTEMTRIPEPLLWENVASYIFWLYETRLREKDSENPYTDEDFRYIIAEAPGSVFGRDFNPLKNCFKFVRTEDGTIVRMRKTCCLYYKLPGSIAFCGDCRFNPANKQDPKCETTHIF